MKKVIALFTFLLTSSTALYSAAEVPVDLRGKPPENKLVIHICNQGSRNQLDLANCEVLSDINYSTVMDALSSRLDFPVIPSREKIDVKKGVDPHTFVVTGTPYWETCDAEDGDCIEWSRGAFRSPVESNFLITKPQREMILAKLIANSRNQNTHLYFSRSNVTVRERHIEGIFRYYDLRNAEIKLK